MAPLIASLIRCVYLSFEIKKHPGSLPSTLGVQARRLSALTRSLREAPDLAKHYYERACTLLTMKLFSEAAHDADACLRLQPSFAKARFAKGRALYFLGEYESAFAQYDAGLRLERNPRIESWLAAERQKPEYALPTAPRACKRSPQRPEHASAPHGAPSMQVLLTSPSPACKCSSRRPHPHASAPHGALTRMQVLSTSSPLPHRYAVVAQPGPVALLERLNAAVRAGDIKRLALVLCRVPAHALEQGLVAGWGAPPLHLAASEGQVDACVLLLQRNALAEGRDGRARTPLMLALERGHSECACMLLAHTTALEAKCDSGTTALHRAAARGLGAPLAQLLARKADVACRDAGGRTAVHIACLAGEVVALVQLLSAEGGRACLSMTDADGCPPAHVAARAAYAHPKQSERFLQCVTTCVHFGADGSAGAVASTAEAAAAAAAAGSEIARQLLPLHFYAAALGAIDLLIHLVMKLLAPPPVPTTTLGAAAAPTLVHHPASALSRPLETLSQGLGVLHFAAAHGQLSCLRLLLAHGAPPDQVDASGMLPTDHALRGVPGHVLPGEGHAECHLLLLRHLAR